MLNHRTKARDRRSRRTLTLILPDPRDITLGFALHKLFFLGLKWLPIFCLSIFIARKRGAVAAAIFCISLFSCSAFAFFGKYFSPEFVVFALTALAISCAAYDNFRLVGWMHVAIVCAVLAIFTKLTAAPVLAAVLCIIGLAGINKKRPAHLLLLACSATVAAAVSMLSCFSLEGWKSYVDWGAANAVRTIQAKNVWDWLFYTSKTWEFIPLSGAKGFLGIITAAYYLSLALIRTGLEKQKLPLVIFIAGLTGILITVGTSGYLDWYLWPSVLMVLFSSAYVCFAPSKLDLVMLGLIALITSACSISETLRRVNMRQFVLAELAISNQHEVRQLSKLISCYDKAVILTDLFVAFQGDSYQTARLIRVRDAITLAGGPVPVDYKYFVTNPSSLAKNVSPGLSKLDYVTHILINEHLDHMAESPLSQLVGVRVSEDRQQASIGKATFMHVASLDGRALYELQNLSCTH
jgi:hypothetical protein